MTDDKVTLLKPVSGPSASIDAEGFLGELSNFVKSNQILTEWDEADLELEYPRSDETKIGELTYVERQLYLLSQLLNQIIRDEMVEIQAASTDTLVKIMREQKIGIEQAASRVAQSTERNLDPDTHSLLVQLAVTSGTANSMFEWLVRMRCNEWSRRIIVRKGYTAYSYG